MRKYIAVLALFAVVLSTGCLGLTTYEAPEPTVDNATSANTSYELTEQEELVINESIRVTNIEVTSHLNSYERQNPTNQSIPFPTSRYIAISTPSVSVGGVELNPIILDPTDSTFDRVEERADESIKLGDQVGELNRTYVNGQNMTIKEYDGSIEIEEVGAQFDATILSSVVETDDSVLVMLGAYPSKAGDQKEDLVEMMINTTTVNESSSEENQGSD